MSARDSISRTRRIYDQFLFVVVSTPRSGGDYLGRHALARAVLGGPGAPGNGMDDVMLWELNSDDFLLSRPYSAAIGDRSTYGARTCPKDMTRRLLQKGLYRKH